MQNTEENARFKSVLVNIKSLQADPKQEEETITISIQWRTWDAVNSWYTLSPPQTRWKP